MSYLVPPTTTATRAPTATDDAADGFRLGWLWVDTTARVAYLLVDATAGAAVWLQLAVLAAGVLWTERANLDYQQTAVFVANSDAPLVN